MPIVHPDSRPSARLSPSETAAVEAFVAAARHELGPQLHAVRLFGSRARGEGNEDSDVDIAVIVAPGARARRYSVYDLAYDIGLAHGVNLAPLVIEEPQLHEWRARERAIAHAIDTEGIPL